MAPYNEDLTSWKSQCHFPHYMYYLHYHDLSCSYNHILNNGILSMAEVGLMITTP